MAYTRDRLGELLVGTGVITQEQLTDALAYQQLHGGKLGQVLVKNLVVDEDTVARTLADQKGLEYVSLSMFPIDRDAASLIPARVAKRSSVIPIGFRDGSLLLAMSDPLDVETIDDMYLRTQMQIQPVVATASQIDYAVEKYITASDAFEGLAASMAEDVEEDIEAIVDEDVPVVRLVNQLIREAVMDKASDIHLEPGANGVRVRFRVDGVLHEVMTAPSSARAGIVSRIKVMADMDISERRRPQDGRIGLVVNERMMDMRVATLPTPFGENVVIRVLNHESEQPQLEDLGMGKEQQEIVQRFLARSYGEILVSGPTGSGKSTTLYAALTRINDPSLKIITIEDPIEYQVAGVTQMAVNPGIGLTFAHLLRTVLRSDPDIVMVGEIRDEETAQIATRAALTGHLVLSSIHTNDAPSALTRLTDMRVAPFVASSALIGVIAQRLVRRLCPECRERVKLTKTMLSDRGFSAEEFDAKTVWVPGPDGCEACNGTGYRGRVGVFEVMPMDDELERLFLAEAPAEQIRAAALAAGMKTLRADALDKVAQGITSLDEVARVVV